MSLPRQVLPGEFYMLTRRCTQRQFLLRPDAITNGIVLYCLAEAARRYAIEVILPSVMSNHHHTIVFDRWGYIVEFTEHFHKLVARALNARWGRSENFWSSEPPSLVRLARKEDVIAKLVYAATNPVKDGLVDAVHQWPGLNGLDALLNDRVLSVRRPRHFFRDSGAMPSEARLALVIPPELGDADEVRRTLRALVVEVERQLRERRQRSGARVLGRRAILQQSWCGSPHEAEPRGGIRPAVAARSIWARIEALGRNRAFVSAHRAARALWLAGVKTLFPAGTYWLRRFANVPVATAVAN
jgi:REP element-mobilizing transposase RayT